MKTRSTFVPVSLTEDEIKDALDEAYYHIIAGVVLLATAS